MEQERLVCREYSGVTLAATARRMVCSRAMIHASVPSLAGARAAASQWARQLLDRQDWVLLDTETTGLDNQAEVVQIGVLGPDGRTLLDTLVRPAGPIPRDASRIHGITGEMVAGAPAFAAVHAELQARLGGATVVCYNAAFDRRLLDQTARMHRCPPLAARWDCAMEQYARFTGRWSASRGKFLYVPLPRNSPGSSGSSGGAGSAGSASGFHRAINDCLATLEVIRQMAAAG